MSDSIGGAGKRPGRQPPWEKTEPEPGSFGEWLRRQREMREISLRDIAERTKISLRYLEAMEEDRFDALPAPIFAKGFLREYARYVGLSPDEVVNHYLSVQKPQDLEEAKKEETRTRRERARKTRGWTWGLFLLLAGALLLALVAFFAWAQKRQEDSSSSQQTPPPSVAAPAATVAQMSSTPPPEAPSAPLEVSLDFTENCWVEAVIDTKNRLSELRVQGESLQLEAKQSVVLTLGNAGAVEIQVNGYPLDTGKKKGEVLHDLLIDLETVRALRDKERRADVADSQASLVEQVRSGTNRQLQLLAASGLLPLAPEEMIPLQVELAHGRDQEISQKAVEALRGVDARLAGAFLERQATESVLVFFANQSSNSGLIETILRRRDVPRRVLMDLARRVPPDLQEILILRQDAILEEPGILVALEGNPQVSSYTRRRIAEYREHLLPRDRTAGPPPPVVEMDEADLAVTVSAVKRALPADGEVEEQTGLTEGQIRLLPVPARLKLSRGAGRVLRWLLMRDSNTQVALSALLSNNLPEQEVEQVANSRSVAEEILEAIARKREWVSRYSVAKALVKNPKTPLPISLKLVNRMAVKDLRDLSRDKNVPDAVRSSSLRLYRIKQK